MLPIIHDKKPLIHHLTNTVTINDCANMTLALGGSPVMAEDVLEVEEMVGLADAVVINTGTLHPAIREAQLLAGKTANRLGKPIILDPVGTGATTLRTNFINELMHDIQFTVIKGNASEIKTLLGQATTTKGVDVAEGESLDLQAVHTFAAQTKQVIVVTGPIDYVTDGSRQCRLDVGTKRLGQVTGTGCMTASLIATFLGAGYDRFEAAVYGTYLMGKAGELADRQAGIGDFRTGLFNAVSLMTEEMLQEVQIDGN
ncbi:hydroxyethylthiazole kinase [Exiguobacterium sp. KRL4]|uniref:hydroxyethylthiazole kinase n=1 Tax=Exiguobacterium sp. KRL4 TaxID=1914536 RepID=UPI0008F80EF2|nr:hydroxyethylthiazole kinase [Exiguobacterium sp. KRL4]OIN66285.1 hydroxyethylthiazole kinase [Exiguobacterium sp. KRL4]